MKSEYQIIAKHKYSQQLAEKIKYLRKSKGFTQEQLAIKTGVTRPAVAQWESKHSHQRTIPALDTLDLISSALGVDVDYFIKDIGDNVDYLKLSTAQSKESISVLDFLDSVPKDAFHIYQHNKLCLQEIKYGVICDQAAREIRRLQKEVEVLLEASNRNIDRNTQ
jgi:transcriptional regulator with XRE-family HTH domain